MASPLAVRTAGLDLQPRAISVIRSSHPRSPFGGSPRGARSVEIVLSAGVYARHPVTGRRVGGLAVARALGDGELKGVGVTPEPEVRFFTLSPPASATPTAGARILASGRPRVRHQKRPSVTLSHDEEEGGVAGEPLSPLPAGDGGDAFLVVASDGIWCVPENAPRAVRTRTSVALCTCTHRPSAR